MGPLWTIVELKSPRENPLNKDSTIPKYCHDAIQQINDYRHWLGKNIAYAQGQGFHGIDGDCDAMLIIGRLDTNRDEAEPWTLRNKKLKEHVDVASHDRIADSLSQRADFLRARITETQKLKEAMSSTSSSKAGDDDAPEAPECRDHRTLS